MRIDHAVVEKLAGLIHHRDLAAGANARIDRQHRELPGGRRQQQVLQILAEHPDRFHIGALLQFQPDFGLDGEIQQPLVAILDGQFQMRRPVARPLAGPCSSDTPAGVPDPVRS